jgi:WD40 repeat protein/energy-coupling factor transporter ATP-binding protein EcfA2
VLLPGVADPFDDQHLPPFLSTRTWVDLRGGTGSRRALQRLLNAIKGVAQGSATPAEPVDGVVPYRGLESFEEEHAEFFFGRDHEVQRLLEILKASRLLCVVGPSGSGKSSLVRAGLIPRLRDGALADVDDCTVCLLRPGAHPLQALATQLAPLGTGSSMQATLDDLATDRRTLHLAVSLALGADTPRSRVLIVVDQLEEVFTLCSDEREREQFFANLLHAAFASGGQTVVVLTVRADFYARCAEYPELAQRTARSLALIGAMNTDGLRRAIEEPARRVGLFLESGLVQTILDDVGPDGGALPLLEHALLEVWRRRLGDQLTLDGYVQAGRVEGALAKRAESVFSSFTAEQQQIARRTLLRLTQPGEGTEDTRRRATRRELSPAEGDDSFDEVLGRLVDARLLTTGRDETGREVVDVSHEALIRGWPRMRGWIDSDRAGLLTHRRLTDAAHEWDILEREPAALHRGARLAAAREWASDHPDDLSRLERDFLTASEAADRRRARRLKILAIGSAALTVIVATLAVWALDRSSTAQHQRSRAELQAAKATSLALAASASSLVNRRPDVSLLLALEAFRASPGTETRSTALAALVAARAPGVLAILHGHTDEIESVAFSPDGRTLASAADDTTIRFWNARTHKQLGAPLRGHTNSVTSVAFSPDGRTLASGGADRTIRFWDARTHKQLGAPVRGHTSFVSSVAFSPDGRTLASASGDTSIRFWDARTHKQLGAPLTSHADVVSSVTFSGDGRVLASAGADRTIRLWNTHTHKQLDAPLTGHTSFISSVAFAPTGHMLASASSDKTIRLWNTRTHKQLGAPLTGHTGVVGSVAFSPDGRTLASASSDKTIRSWNTHTHKQLDAPLTGHTDSVRSVAFSPDGRTLASASADKTIRSWDVNSREPLAAPLRGHTDVVRSVAFSRDGRTLASAGGDKTIRLWNLHTHKPISVPLTGHTGSVRSLTFSPDGRMLASAGEDRTIRLWNARTHKQLVTLTGHSDVVHGVAFSPDGRTLASASADHTIQLWDVGTHAPLGRPLTGHTHAVFDVAFSPDGHTLASAGDDTTVRLWDVRTHEPLGRPLTGHTGFVSNVAFSPDGDTLATASDDTTVRLWSARTHKQIGVPLTGHTDVVETVTFSPDGRTLASAGDDRTVRLWKDILWRNFAELQNKVCNLVGSGLSTTEWAQYASGIPYHRSCP